MRAIRVIARYSNHFAFKESSIWFDVLIDLY